MTDTFSNDPENSQGPTLAQLDVATETRSLTDDEALFVLSLIQDGRAVPERLSAMAAEHGQTHPSVVAALGDFGLISEAFRAEAADPASASFTSRVLGQARAASPPKLAPNDPPTPSPELAQSSNLRPSLLSFQLARRMAVAAALLLSLTLSWDALRPAPAAADPAQEQEFYRGDVFRPDPYGPVALDLGLQELLPGRLDVSPNESTDEAASPEEQDLLGGQAEDGR